MQATPIDSRYVPFTQQPWCCVPTSIQMVMYKQGIPLLPAEEIGYHLGLVIPPEKAHFFYNVRTSTTPPTAGYGTRIYESEFELNVAFKNMGIPLNYRLKPISEISSTKMLLDELNTIERQNGNGLLCFNHGALVDDPSRDWGHVVVFDRVIDGQLRIIDPGTDYPKWRLVKPQKMFEAMKKHGERKTAAGIWILSTT